MKQFIHLWLRGIWWLIRIAAPINVALFPLMAIYGTLNHWEPADQALKNYANQTAIMVGTGEEYQYSAIGGNVHEYSSNQRSYILFPSVLNDPKLVIVKTTNNEPYQVAESKEAFVFLVLWYLLCIFGTWWFWFRPRRLKSQLKVT